MKANMQKSCPICTHLSHFQFSLTVISSPMFTATTKPALSLPHGEHTHSPFPGQMGSSTFPVLFFFLVFFSAAAELSSAAVYRVGDSSGWTIIGNINYTAWASSKDFHVADTLLFVYNKQFHNVLEVTKQDYRTCNASAPIAVYTSGNDTVSVRRRGHTFFICGVAGHCALGQKVDIRVPKDMALVGIAPQPVLAPAEVGVPAMAPAERGGAGRIGMLCEVVVMGGGVTWALLMVMV